MAAPEFYCRSRFIANTSAIQNVFGNGLGKIDSVKFHINESLNHGHYNNQ